MLSFGGLLSEILQGGAAGLTASNPGIVKVLGGFVFPVGLVMWVAPYPKLPRLKVLNLHRIILQGQELLTSNMMVSPSDLSCHVHILSFHRLDLSYGGIQTCGALVELTGQLAYR